MTKQSIILSAKPVWLHRGPGATLRCTIFPLCAFPLATNLFSSPPSPEQMDLTTLLTPPPLQPQTLKKRTEILAAPPPAQVFHLLPRAPTSLGDTHTHTHTHTHDPVRPPQPFRPSHSGHSPRKQIECRHCPLFLSCLLYTSDAADDPRVV